MTGVPNSGKSEWIDALICNLAMRHGWSFALCSMEKKVCHHVAARTYLLILNCVLLLTAVHLLGQAHLCSGPDMSTSVIAEAGSIPCMYDAAHWPPEPEVTSRR